MDKYYEDMERELKEAKENDHQRGTKKEIKFIENSECRRVTYSRRSRSLVMAAKELEVQTHCRVEVSVEPTWPNGKGQTYRSRQSTGSGTAPTTTAAPAAQPDGPATGDFAHSPIRKRPMQATARPVLVPAGNKSTSHCRICGDQTELSFWLGCGYTNPKTRRQDCTYWVHQNCIGLYYKQRAQLEKVPFYCKKHAPK